MYQIQVLIINKAELQSVIIHQKEIYTYSYKTGKDTSRTAHTSEEPLRIHIWERQLTVKHSVPPHVYMYILFICHVSNLYVKWYYFHHVATLFHALINSVAAEPECTTPISKPTILSMFSQPTFLRTILILSSRILLCQNMPIFLHVSSPKFCTPCFSHSTSHVQAILGLHFTIVTILCPTHFPFWENWRNKRMDYYN